jgi:hypothetical protein
MISQFSKRNNYMNITKTTSASIIAGTLLLAVPVFAESSYAPVSVSAGITANADVGSTTVGVKAQANAQARLTDAKNRADQEITRRMTALTDLNTAVQAMVHVSATEKTSISTEVQTEISSLTSLKSTIDAETVLANLKTDIQSITKDYRIFMLVIPQGRIEVAADKVQTVAAIYTTFATKLQTRISDAPSGTDTTQATQWLSDMNAKITDANAQAQAAVSLVASLQPDQGSATVAASNETALKSARADIKSALADLKTARQDAGSIVKAIESWHVSASASSTTSTQ